MESNMQKIRDALVASFELIQKLERLISAGEEHPAYAKLRADVISGVITDEIPNVVMKIGRALSMLKKFPIRQCDVGTPEDQAERFHDFCAGNSSGINGMCKPTCPCVDCFDKCQCFAKWAQTPYEAQEGENNG